LSFLDYRDVDEDVTGMASSTSMTYAQVSA